MKKFALYSLVFSALTMGNALALDKDADIQIRSLEQQIVDLSMNNEQLLQQMRELERKNDTLEKHIAEVMKNFDALSDEVLKIRNVDVANLRSGQKGLYDQIPLFTWGEDTEDCPEINTKHQQTNTQKSTDGRQTMRFLCFDGKAIHLGTEYHGVPQ